MKYFCGKMSEYPDLGQIAIKIYLKVKCFRQTLKTRHVPAG